MVSLFSAVRDLDRLRQIYVVLVRHGFGELAQRLGLGKRPAGPGPTQGATPPTLPLVATPPAVADRLARGEPRALPSADEPEAADPAPESETLPRRGGAHQGLAARARAARRDGPRPLVRQARPDRLHAPRRDAARVDRRAEEAPGRGEAPPVLRDRGRGGGIARPPHRRGLRELRREAPRRRVDRAGAPRGAPPP